MKQPTNVVEPGRRSRFEHRAETELPDVVYVTCCENGLYGLRRLHAEGVPIRRVVTISPETAERCAVSGFVDVTDTCRRLGVPVVVLDDYRIRREDVAGRGDLLVVNGWNRLVKPEVLACFPLGGLGIHAGHPPIGLGRAPLPWNLIKGHADLEAYVFRLTESADDGDVLASRVVEITATDDVRTLYEKVMFAGAGLFRTAIEKVARGERGAPQAHEHAVHYPKRSPSDGLIDFHESCERLYDFVRAQTRPYPGAFARLEGEEWRIWRAVPFNRHAFRDDPRVPGRILAALPSGLVVTTGSAPLWITAATCGARVVVPAPLEALEAHVGRTFEGAPATDR